MPKDCNAVFKDKYGIGIPKNSFYFPQINQTFH